MKNYWLVKSEPDAYSWSDLVAEGKTSWTGVRNFTARNNLRSMRVGDEVLFYHSVTDKAVVGVTKVVRAAYPDPTAKEGDWSTVDLAPIKPLRHPVTLDQIKARRPLKNISLVRQSRLSVHRSRAEEFREILASHSLMRPRRDRSGTALLFALAATTVVVHCLVGGRYGFHRDELATLDDARHLAWGYVAYPPVTPFFGWLSLHFFGTSLPGFRFFASLAGAAAIVLTGLMARELGGTRGAQLLAAAATTPIVLGIGSLMQYVSFDYLAWVGVAYFMIKLCRTWNARWWLAVGTAIGFGMLSKYSMPFLVAGIALGVLVGDLRTHLRSKYLWLGAALALFIFLPNFIWQWHHDFISLDFLHHNHASDIRIGRTRTFLPDQMEITSVALLRLRSLAFTSIFPTMQDVVSVF